MDSTRAVVKNYLLKKLLSGERPENLADDTELKESGILDSLATVELAMFLEEQFGIELAASDLETANLITIASIAHLVETKTAGR
jgi:acyl carrier protein